MLNRAGFRPRAEEVGVASRWRIRQKLMFGLGLVVVIMALLLAGTLRGLYSYYLAMNSIRSKLAELNVAEEFRNEVYTLAAKRKELTDNPQTFAKRTEIARQKLVEYEAQLQETLAHGRDPTNGIMELELIGVLHQRLDPGQELHKAIIQSANDEAERARASGTGSRVEDRDGEESEGGTKDLEAADPATREFRTLVRDADQLRNTIRDVLDHRLNESRRHYQVTLWISVPASIAGLLLVCGLGRSFYAWVFYPIRDLEEGVQRVAHGDFEHRIEVHSGDEMEDLSEAFNDMMARLHALYSDLARQVNERSRQLVRSERLASVGFLAAGVAHEINNPLASIAFCSEALEARLTDLLRHLRASGRYADDHEVFTKYLKMIQEEAFRCKNITERLLEFSRSGERRREPTDLAHLVQSVLDVTQHLQNSRGKRIVFDPQTERGGRVCAWVNAEEIKSVVLNLVVNALDSMDEGGTLTVRLGLRDGLAEVEFTDTGCGMTQEVLENIFEPFFTRSRTGKGTGLGLTISHRIITQHGGEIEAASPGPNQGSTFTIRLPTGPADSPAGAEPPPKGGRTNEVRQTTGLAA
jgi:signal transduction histidine kinase/CHASE3 domain sensor protein